MKFLPRGEAEQVEKKARRQLADQTKPRLVLHYDGGPRDYSEAAAAITASAGAFTEATVLFRFSVSGDGWNDHVTDEAWTAYKRWRSANGEGRRLYDAPGHLFEAQEAQHLTTALAFALRLGWDATLMVSPGRQLLLLSHDDRLEICRGFDRRALATTLIKLRYWYD